MFGGMAMSSTLTIRLPDDTAQRLKALARSRGLSTNKLIEELSAHALAAWDTENHFRALAATGDVNRALEILERLDAEDSQAGA
ncbi:toxin-antitoxin system HicB family antitoxin [Desulfonatronum sp. SC1]|nr:toxin-antitoxin system HicB family antitoxin [Desulfonatronum sp. SC1]